MRRQRTIPFHESFEIGILLALVGGFLDAYTYLLKGKVFANAQTGNMVLFGIQIAQKQYAHAVYYFIPIAAFALGVFVTEFLKRHTRLFSFFRWQSSVLAIEILTLFILGLLPSSVPNTAVNVTISFVCSLQACSFKKLIDTPYATTMCTGNLRCAMEHLFCCMAQRDAVAGKKALRYLTIIFFFCMGAALGAVFSSLWKERSIWICCLLLLSILTILIVDDLKKPRQQL